MDSHRLALVILKYAFQGHEAEMRAADGHPNAELHARQALLDQNLGSVGQLQQSYHRLSEIFSATTEAPPENVSAHPLRLMGMARQADRYLQELGFKSIEKDLYTALSNAQRASSQQL